MSVGHVAACDKSWVLISTDEISGRVIVCGRRNSGHVRLLSDDGQTYVMVDLGRGWPGRRGDRVTFTVNARLLGPG